MCDLFDVCESMVGGVVCVICSMCVCCVWCKVCNVFDVCLCDLW